VGGHAYPKKLYSDPHPTIPAYPVCPTCDMAFILRRCYSLSEHAWTWLWQRDCKHRDVAPEVVET